MLDPLRCGGAVTLNLLMRVELERWEAGCYISSPVALGKVRAFTLFLGNTDLRALVKDEQDLTLARTF